MARAVIEAARVVADHGTVLAPRPVVRFAVGPGHVRVRVACGPSPRFPRVAAMQAHERAALSPVTLEGDQTNLTFRIFGCWYCVLPGM